MFDIHTQCDNDDGGKKKTVILSELTSTLTTFINIRHTHNQIEVQHVMQRQPSWRRRKKLFYQLNFNRTIFYLFSMYHIKNHFKFHYFVLNLLIKRWIKMSTNHNNWHIKWIYDLYGQLMWQRLMCKHQNKHSTMIRFAWMKALTRLLFFSACFALIFCSWLNIMLACRLF